MSSSDITSIIFVSNLHCTSCIHTIHTSLNQLNPQPTSIHVSIVSQSVTVVHSPTLSLHQLQLCLHDAAFDIPELVANVTASPDRHSRHFEQCTMCCQNKSSDTDVRDKSIAPIAETHQQHPSTLSGSLTDLERESPLRVTYLIGGMTCTACSGAISRGLDGIPGLSQVLVNLLDNSLTLLASDRCVAESVIESVEDMGYECRIVQIDSLADLESIDGSTSRTVEIKVDGMMCERCPDQILEAFKPLLKTSQLAINQKPLYPQQPILKLTYFPQAPLFTIRDILEVISSISPPGEGFQHPFRASIYQPPSVETLSKQMRQKERRALLLRLAINFGISIPTFIIGIVFMTLLPSSHRLRMWVEKPVWKGTTSRAVWALFILSTFVQFYCAMDFHKRAIKEIYALWKRNSRVPLMQRFIRFGSMNLLISLGISVAYFSSIGLLVISSSATRSLGDHGETNTYFDSVVFLNMFLLFGRYLEAYSKSKTADAVASLGKLRPPTALLAMSGRPEKAPALSHDVDQESMESIWVKTKCEMSLPTRSDLFTTEFRTIPLENLELHDVVVVVTGSSPPADGVVVSKVATTFDESSLTGESKPVVKRPGDRVFVGTICKGPAATVCIDKLTGETMLDHVVSVVRSGQSKRAPIERVADLLTGYFVPIVVMLSLATWMVWLILGEVGALPADYLDITIGGWPVWSLRFAIAVFVVACPCGIGLAAPTALLVGSGLAAKAGILVHGGGEAFQEAAQLDIVVFDKTGTLTVGEEPTITDVEMFGDEPESRVLAMAVALEQFSSHPLARAVMQYSKSKNAAKIESKAVEEIPGRGIKGVFEDQDQQVVVGNEALLLENGVILSTAQENLVNGWKTEGKSVVLLAERKGSSMKFREVQGCDWTLCAAFGVADPLRPEAPDVVRRLQEHGYGVWIMSGDNIVTAKAIANSVGIPTSNVIAGVLPHEKADYIRWLQSVGLKRHKKKHRLNERAIVAMCGDGINDAPALSTADVGIAIGSGSDVAISSASFILVSSNLSSILTMIDLSKVVFRRIKFNFAWAIIYNVVAVPIAAGALYPAGHIRLDPVWASLAMALSSVSVVSSSLLLKLYRGPQAI